MKLKTSYTKTLPDFLKKYFPDVDFVKLDAKKRHQFVIERILEYGDQNAVKWMMDNFEKFQIKNALMKRRGISPKSANYWALILNVPKNKILCLKKSCQKMKETHWLC